MGPNIGIWGTAEFVWSSRLRIYSQIRSSDLPAGIRDPNLGTFDIGVTPISKVNVKILPQYELMGSVDFSTFFRRLLTMNRRFLKLGSFCPKVRSF